MTVAERAASVIGPLPDSRVAPDRDVAEVIPLRTEERGSDTAIHFQLRISDGDNVPGVALIPSVARVPHGAVALAFHQTTVPVGVGKLEPVGIAGETALAYGRSVAARGVPVVALDHPGFGGYLPDTYALGFESVTGHGISNYLELLRSSSQLLGAQAAGCVTIGHSLGGTNAMFFNLYCDSVVATACSGSATTFADFASAHHGDLSRFARDDKYMPLIGSLYENDPKKIDFDIPDVLSAFAPRPMLICHTQGDEIFPIAGATACINRVRAAYRELRSDASMHEWVGDGSHSFPEQAQSLAAELLSQSLAAG